MTELMTNDRDLRGALALAIQEATSNAPDRMAGYWRAADACLAALGLDDFDAAVERGAAALPGWLASEFGLDSIRSDVHPTRSIARAVLEAALAEVPAHHGWQLCDDHRFSSNLMEMLGCEKCVTPVAKESQSRV